MHFPPGSAAEIVLANVKDEYYIHELKDLMTSMAEDWLAPEWCMRLKPEISLLASICYCGLTTGTGLQMLGEEYANIFQIDKIQSKPASLSRRWILIIMRCIIPYLIERSKRGWVHLFNTRMEGQIRRQIQSQGILAPVRVQETTFTLRMAQMLDRWVARVPIIPAISSQLSSIHLAIFYIYGTYYTFSHRISGIQYLRNRRLDQPPVSFALIGYMMLMKHGVQGLSAVYQYWKVRQPQRESQSAAKLPSATEEEKTACRASKRYMCTVCLGIPTCPTLTPCGHVFCWDCIVNSVPRQSKCPLCRQDFTPQQLRCIYGY